MWRYNYIYPNELCHYGVKGMKWGVRRSKEELRYDRGSIASVVNRAKVRVKLGRKTLVARTTSHAAEQAEKRGVCAAHIVDALRNPMVIETARIDANGRSIRFIGQHATVNVSPVHGGITTVWKTGKRFRKKYGGARK